MVKRISKAEAKRRFTVGTTWLLSYNGNFTSDRNLGERTVKETTTAAVGFSRSIHEGVSWLDFGKDTTFRESDDDEILVFENDTHILTYKKK